MASLNLWATSSVNTHKYAPEQIYVKDIYPFIRRIYVRYMSKTVLVYRCNLYVELFYHVYIHIYS